MNWEGRWTDRKEEMCVSRRLRKAGEWKGAFAAEGECVKKASTICNSLVKKIDCLIAKRIVWCVNNYERLTSVVLHKVDSHVGGYEL